MFNLRKMIGCVVCFILLIPNVALANTPESDVSDYSAKLLPYQEIIDKVNLEYGSSIHIPEGDEETVYNNLSEMSLEDFEEDLRSSYLNVIDMPDTIELDGGDLELSRENGLSRGYTYTDTQTYTFSNGIVYITTETYDQGNIVTYNRLLARGSKKPSSGDYFYVTQDAFAGFSYGNTQCFIMFEGHMRTQAGVILTVQKRVSVTFKAGAGNIKDSLWV